MCESIVFSSKEADRLNSIVKKNIDSKLFLFAYYSPKSSVDVGELGFWKGITNIYGLFIDCAAFMKNGENNFLSLLNDKKIINDNEFKLISNLMNTVTGIRSLFSHNSSPQYSKSNNNLSLLKNFLKKALNKEIEASNLEEIILSEDEWKQCTNHLVEKAREFVSILESALSVITEHQEKKGIIEEWSQLIIEWYKKKANDLLYNALNNKLSLYLLLRQKKNSNKRLYITAWNSKYKQTCMESMDSLRSSEKCKELLPIEFFDCLIENTKPFDFWDKYTIR